ncbi:MAG: transketolase [Actinobacteria bacterium]|nr:transketolase [Actinomycetota bacterium]
MNDKGKLNSLAIAMARHVVKMTTASGSGHPSSGLSLVHIVAALMGKHMRWDPSDPWNPTADRLVLSEGHAVPAVYAAMAELGAVVGKDKQSAKPVTAESLLTLRAIDSPLDGHPNPRVGAKFFDSATGSLGQGASTAAGLALAARLDSTGRRVFVLIGDGESREGQIWEACDFIIDHKLANVTLIFNCNGQGQSDYVSSQQSGATLSKKLRAFGFKVLRINGHDPEAILCALAEAASSEVPVAIVAKTVKGWGVTELKKHTYHGKPLTEKQLGKALKDIDHAAQKLGLAEAALERVVPPLPQGNTTSCCGSCGSDRLQDPDFAELLAGDKYLSTFEKGKMSTRRAYGLALRELGKINPLVVALDADVSNSTFTEYFAKAFPSRYFECRIAEQNMVSAAVGLAAAGKIPFVSSFAKFLSRAFDQIEMAVISGHGVKIVGSHAGVTLGPDGPSQMGVTDVPFFRSFPADPDGSGEPAVAFFCPADGVAAYKCTQLVVDHPGVCYLRTLRSDMPLLYSPDTEFELGGAKTLAVGKDLTILTSGYMVHLAKQAVAALAEEGIKAGLVDCYSFPLKAMVETEAVSNGSDKLLTLEDNYTGGLGSAVAEIVAGMDNFQLSCMYLGRFPKSGKTADDILDYVGLGLKQVLAKARQVAGR